MGAVQLFDAGIGIGQRNLVKTLGPAATGVAGVAFALAAARAGARAAATAKGRRIGRPSVVDADKIAYATHLRDTGHTIAQIVTKSGITRTSLYRHLPPRPPEPLTAGQPTNRPRNP